jgi:hypothetical protein
MNKSDSVMAVVGMVLITIGGIVAALLFAMLLSSCDTGERKVFNHMGDEYDSGIVYEKDGSVETDTIIQYGFCLTIHWCSNTMPVECYHGEMWIECDNPYHMRTCKCDVYSNGDIESRETQPIADCPWTPPNTNGRFLLTRPGLPGWAYPPVCAKE